MKQAIAQIQAVSTDIMILMVIITKQTSHESKRTPVTFSARDNDMTTYAVIGMCQDLFSPFLSVVFGCATKQ